jgi:hypothetical protein
LLHTGIVKLLHHYVIISVLRDCYFWSRSRSRSRRKSLITHDHDHDDGKSFQSRTITRDRDRDRDRDREIGDHAKHYFGLSNDIFSYYIRTVNK